VANNRRKELWIGGAVVAAGLILLPVTLPVALGMLLAALLEPMILGLQRRTGVGRTLASGITVTGVLVGVGGVLWLLGGILVHEAAGLSERLPEMLSGISEAASRLTMVLRRAAQGLPDGVSDALLAWSEELLSGSGTLAQKLYEFIFSLVTRFLGALPSSLFFLMTLILSAYFAAGELPRIRDLMRTWLPGTVKHWAALGARGVRTALSGWLRAQIKLMAVTFGVLTLGFLLLGVGSPLLLGLLISLLDALPVFGTGTVLIPWGMISLITGDVGLGVGLMGLYGGAVLLRNVLEPKVLGQTLGLSPLLTLVAIYAGWRVAGLWGMIGFPVAAMVLAQILSGAREGQQPAKLWQKSPKKGV